MKTKIKIVECFRFLDSMLAFRTLVIDFIGIAIHSSVRLGIVENMGIVMKSRTYLIPIAEVKLLLVFSHHLVLHMSVKSGIVQHTSKIWG